MLYIVSHCRNTSQNCKEIPLRTKMAIFKKANETEEDMETLECVCIVGGNLKWYSYCGKLFGPSSKR